MKGAAVSAVSIREYSTMKYARAQPGPLYVFTSSPPHFPHLPQRPLTCPPPLPPTTTTTTTPSFENKPVHNPPTLLEHYHRS